MICAKYREKGNTYLLEVQGHAGAAPKGQDLVCASVSILGQTAAQRVLNLYSSGKLLRFPEVIMSDGSLLVMAAEPDGRRVCRDSFHTILTGLRMLAEQYPQHLKLEEIL